MRKALVPECICVFMLMLAACASGPHMRNVALQDVENKDLVKLNRMLNAKGRPVNMDYAHPHDFTASEMGFELGLLKLKKFQWGKFGMGNKWVEKPIFEETSREKLIPALVSAFREAARSDRIAFNVSGRKGQPTTGEVYLKDNQLVWVFEAIDGFPFTGKDKFWLDGEQWTIEEKDGLVVKEDARKQIIEVARDLRVEPAEIAPEGVAPAAARERISQPPPQPAEPTVSSVPEEAVSRGVEQLDKKLETLKEWKDEGLITDEEYAKEKARIIEELHGL